MLWITVERPRKFGVCIVYNDAIESSRYPGEQNILDGAPIQNGVKATYSVLFLHFHMFGSTGVYDSEMEIT